MQFLGAYDDDDLLTPDTMLQLCSQSILNSVFDCPKSWSLVAIHSDEMT